METSCIACLFKNGIQPGSESVCTIALILTGNLPGDLAQDMCAEHKKSLEILIGAFEHEKARAARKACLRLVYSRKDEVNAGVTVPSVAAASVTPETVAFAGASTKDEKPPVSNSSQTKCPKCSRTQWTQVTPENPFSFCVNCQLRFCSVCAQGGDPELHANCVETLRKKVAEKK
jgi:hypothetical protein